jgi:hypothetical protein
MTDQPIDRQGVQVLVCAADGPVVSSPQDALDLIAQGADVVALPATRLDPRFFELRTGIAGEIMQKFVNYRTHLAVVGDIDAYQEQSESFAALVRESNRGRHIWFVDDLDGLDEHLARPAGGGVGQRP